MQLMFFVLKVFAFVYNKFRGMYASGKSFIFQKNLYKTFINVYKFIRCFALNYGNTNKS